MVPLPLCTSTESEPTVGFPLAPLQLRVPAPTLAFGQNCQLSTVVSNDQTLRDPDAEVHKGGGAASGPADVPPVEAPPVDAPPLDAPPLDAPPALASAP